MNEKPREFWIERNIEAHSIRPVESALHRYIHVIEYSAYEQVCQTLKYDVDKIAAGYEKELESLRLKNEKLVKALEEIASQLSAKPDPSIAYDALTEWNKLKEEKS